MRTLPILAAATTALIGGAHAASSDLIGTWRLARGTPAPWWDVSLSYPVQIERIGKMLTFSETELKGFSPLDCKNAHYEPTLFPAVMLFQGGLENEPEEAAERLGLVNGPFAGVSFACDTGLFEFHRADDDTMLFALDNVVWTMSRAYGATAADGAPEGVVQILLEQHFSDMAFTPGNISAIRELLTKPLSKKIDAYQKQIFPDDVAPPINGDPFTDSQEYPTRFAVRMGKIEGSRASVPADFADGYQTRRVIYLLRRQNGAWRVDNLAYAHGATLRALLRTKPH